MDIGPSEAETFWTAFLRKLSRRGLRGVTLVISDSHEGLKAAAAKVLCATWRRCRVGVLKYGRQAEAIAALLRLTRGGIRICAARIAASVQSMAAMARPPGA